MGISDKNNIRWRKKKRSVNGVEEGEEESNPKETGAVWMMAMNVMKKKVENKWPKLQNRYEALEEGDDEEE